MRLKIHTPFLLSVVCLTLLGCLLVPQAEAYPSLYTARCATCHTDDTPSCDGCHEHRGNLSASTDQPTYDPGSIINVTLNGGSRGGWVRGLLYDQAGTEIDQQGGPTGTGDDGAGSAVTFPVSLQATAPTTPGEYTWSVAWFGAPNSGGGSHIENSVPVTFTVMAPSFVPEEEPPVLTWDLIRSLYR
jgi:hypothetical protein